MKKMVVFSDLHAHLFQEFSEPDPEFGNDRFRKIIDTLDRVYQIALENDAEVLFAGDLFHARGRLEDIVFNKVYDTVAKYSSEGVVTYLLRGNHDSKTNRMDSEHWLETFKHLPNVTVMDRMLPVYTKDFDIYPAPYSDNTEEIKEGIEKYVREATYSENRTSILVGHLGVDGSSVGKYNHRLEGAFTLDDLHTDKFDFVALGHYHKRQFLNDNTFYVGNTIQTSFSDEGQSKGVFLLEKGKEPEYIEIDNPQFITLKEIPDNVDEMASKNYLWFVLPRDKAQAVNLHKDQTAKVRVDAVKEYTAETRINIDVDSTHAENVASFCDKYYPEVKELAIEILKEVKN
jgi:DNA repair exonuclease SbcCD nuclease subunit